MPKKENKKKKAPVVYKSKDYSRPKKDLSGTMPMDAPLKKPQRTPEERAANLKRAKEIEKTRAKNNKAASKASRKEFSQAVKANDKRSKVVAKVRSAEADVWKKQSDARNKSGGESKCPIGTGTSCGIGGGAAKRIQRQANRATGRLNKS